MAEVSRGLRAGVVAPAAGGMRPRVQPMRLAVGLGVAAVGVAIVAEVLAPASFAGVLREYPDPAGAVRWVLADLSTAQFYGSAIAGAAAVAGVLVAHLAHRRGRRWAGFAVGCGTGNLPWIAAASVGGAIASSLAWGWTVARSGHWEPTFAPAFSVPPAVVVLFGRGWRVLATGVVGGAAITTPLAVLFVDAVCVPGDLPVVTGTTAAMAVSAFAVFALARVLPWMPAPTPRPRPVAGPPPVPAAGPAPRAWLARRALADLTEAQFFGGEWTGGFLLVGLALSAVIAPAVLASGSGLLGPVLASQAITALLAVALWRSQWERAGWYPTFVPIVSVAPTVTLAFGGTTAAVLLGALIGAVVTPPLASVVGARVPQWCHPFVGYTATMAVACALVVPALRLFPGIAG